MDEEVWKNIEKIMKKVKPFIALAILIFIVISTIHLINYNNLQKEVKESCGYQKSEDVYCVCDRGIVSNIDIAGNPYFNHSTSFESLNISEAKDKS